MTRIGFLHTAEVHAETFAQLLHQEDPSATAVHVVDPTLLTDAMDRGGVDENLMQRVAMRLGELETTTSGSDPVHVQHDRSRSGDGRLEPNGRRASHRSSDGR